MTFCDMTDCVNEALLQVAGVADGCLVHIFLHQSPNSVVKRVYVQSVWRVKSCFLLKELDFFHKHTVMLEHMISIAAI